ncbi:MAG: TIGR03905 family TSCPD domain-containing protein [Defluviitaleaceae bacterium]|nr:TIGR03905 family TSCPD domain-containing protein [Defluviitaleaceae bacterium]
MTFKPTGVCAEEISFDIKDGIISDVKFVKGCPGNGLGVASLAKGRTPQEVISILSGIKCGNRPTSCPDQLAAALKKHINA